MERRQQRGTPGTRLSRAWPVDVVHRPLQRVLALLGRDTRPVPFSSQEMVGGGYKRPGWDKLHRRSCHAPSLDGDAVRLIALTAIAGANL